MRVDGSLQGVDDKAGTLIPTWKRGHFSLLFDGGQTPASLLLVDHKKRSVVDLTKEKKKFKVNVDDEVCRCLWFNPIIAMSAVGYLPSCKLCVPCVGTYV